MENQTQHYVDQHLIIPTQEISEIGVNHETNVNHDTYDNISEIGTKEFKVTSGETQ